MQKFIKYGLFLVFVLAFFLVTVSLKAVKEYQYVGSDIPPVNVISFSGKGEVVVIPDLATFTFGVTEEAKNVKDAQLKNTQKINIALARLKDLNIPEKNIKTIAYNVYPKYEYEKQICTPYGCPSSSSTLVGYTVTQTIEVKVEDIEAAGAVLGSMGEVGVTEISGLTFTSKDEEGQIREARKKAIEDAKEKASMLAKDLGVRLVRIVNFTEGGSYPFYYRTAYGMGGMEKDVALVTPSIPTGENKIISEVTITYELGR